MSELRRLSDELRLGAGVTFIRELLRGRSATYRGGTAHLPWVKRPSPVFLAASHPASLRAAGATADGAFINYGLGAENVAESQGVVAQAARAAGRSPADVEIWQIACLDCDEDGDLAKAAHKIAALPQQAVEATKRVLNLHMEQAVLSTIDFALAAENESFDTDELRTNIDRFRA